MMRMETTPSSQSEEDAAGRARRGDRAAMEALYRQYQPSIARLCRQMIEPEEEAADAAQEVFLRVLRTIDRYDPSLGFRVWLFTVARHVIVDYLRRRGKWWDIENDLRRLPPNHAEESLDPVLRGESRDLLRQAVQKLPAPYRLVVIAVMWHDFRPSEVAELLGVPAGRVRVHLFRALKLVEKELSGP
jgi:RNA polymerase sigma-70 factor, ECF subfamily